MGRSSSAQPLPDILRRTADEAADLARLSDGLQGMVARLVSEGANLRVLEDAQAADLLTQRLSGLAAILRGLARVASPDVSADIGAALAALPLADQARRLAGHADPAAPDTGDTLLFWD